jgi:Resolvase, N terminal domain
LLTIRGWVGPHVCDGGRERPREIEPANHVAVGPRVRRRLLPRPLLHAQAASVLDHPGALPQGDGCAGPAFAGGTERGERNLLDPSDVLHDAFAVRGFDMVMAWSVGRLGRSLQDLVGFLSELHALKIDLFLRQQGLDTTTPPGRRCFR